MKTIEDLVEKRDIDPERLLNAYMTHELRAPLTSVRSALVYLQMQLEHMLSPEEKQALDLALKNSDRLNSLINDVLDYSSLKAGKMPIHPEPVYANDLMQEAVECLQSWAISKGMKLVRIESEEPLPRVYADPKKTVQVLVNLLSNAIKFTPPGGRVEVSACLGRHEHLGTVLFKVKDTGPGIPHASLETVFHCFEQSALGVKMSHGTGLGLTIAKAMVELQKGRIWAESWRGLGANFLFTLPIFPKDLLRPIQAYPKGVEYHGLLVGFYRKLNAFVAAFFA